MRTYEAPGQQWMLPGCANLQISRLSSERVPGIRQKHPLNITPMLQMEGELYSCHTIAQGRTGQTLKNHKSLICDMRAWPPLAHTFGKQ